MITALISYLAIGTIVLLWLFTDSEDGRLAPLRARVIRRLGAPLISLTVIALWPYLLGRAFLTRDEDA